MRGFKDDIKTIISLGYTDPDIMDQSIFGKKSGRNKDIVRRAMAGENLKDIALSHGISYDRTLDIIKRAIKRYQFDILYETLKTKPLPKHQGRYITVTQAWDGKEKTIFVNE